MLGWRYRDEDEVAAWREKDPIRRFKQHILESGVLGAAEVETIEAEAKAEIEAAVEFARSSPEPSLDAVYEDLWVTG